MLNADNHSNTASDEGKQLKAIQKVALHRRFIIDNRILGNFLAITETLQHSGF